MENIPKDVLFYEILNKLCPRDISKLGLVSKYFYKNICQNEEVGIWKKLYTKNVSTVKSINWKETDYRQKYFEAFTRFKESEKNPPKNVNITTDIQIEEWKFIHKYIYLLENGYDSTLLKLIEKLKDWQKKYPKRFYSFLNEMNRNLSLLHPLTARIWIKYLLENELEVGQHWYRSIFFAIIKSANKEFYNFRNKITEFGTNSNLEDSGNEFYKCKNKIIFEDSNNIDELLEIAKFLIDSGYTLDYFDCASLFYVDPFSKIIELLMPSLLNINIWLKPKLEAIYTLDVEKLWELIQNSNEYYDDEDDYYFKPSDSYDNDTDIIYGLFYYVAEQIKDQLESIISKYVILNKNLSMEHCPTLSEIFSEDYFSFLEENLATNETLIDELQEIKSKYLKIKEMAKILVWHTDPYWDWNNHKEKKYLTSQHLGYIVINEMRQCYSETSFRHYSSQIKSKNEPMDLKIVSLQRYS